MNGAGDHEKGDGQPAAVPSCPQKGFMVQRMELEAVKQERASLLQSLASLMEASGSNEWGWSS